MQSTGEMKVELVGLITLSSVKFSSFEFDRTVARIVVSFEFDRIAATLGLSFGFDTLRGRSVTEHLMKSASLNILGLKGKIPDARKPDFIFFGVIALSNALEKRLAIS
jgi:hypothetical protein